MSTDHIDAIAQAGYQAYHHHHLYTWENECFPTTCRWTIIAAAFCNGNHDGYTTLGTARQLRNAYTDGIFCAPHSFRTDRIWQRVYMAMARARDAVMVRDEVAA